jgi:signal peptidase I
MTIASQVEPAPEPIEPAPAPPPPPAEPKKESWWSFLRFLLILFAATLVLRSCVVAPFSIPSGSMLPNLVIGDHLFVSKWSYGYSRHSFPFGIISFEGRVLGGLPERGDIVVFRHPTTGDDWVKRVIGLPGDRIAVRDSVLILNGQPVGRERIADFVVAVSPNSPCQPRGGETRAMTDENGRQACSYPRYRETLPTGRSYEIIDQIQATQERCAGLGAIDPCAADNFAEIIVPEGQVFVMGDNRDDSLDSRFPPVIRDPDGRERDGGVGLLPIENIQGRALISFFSTDGSAEWLLPWTWFTAARWSRFGMTYP